jgi:DNA polymerase III sliding clamp (beta) subunit (PCNA family)
MSKATSRDYSRISLTFVYYNKERGEFVATDGHILRLEKFDWQFGEPESSFFLDPAQIMYSKPQLKMLYAPHKWGNTENLLKGLPMEIEYDPDSVAQFGPYPNYVKVLPTEMTDIPSIAVNPALLARLASSFAGRVKSMRMAFAGEMSGISLFVRNSEGVDVMRGIIMPTRHSV